MAKQVPDDTTVVINDEEYTLRLTLGGLARLEEQLGVSKLSELQERLAEPSSRDLEQIALTMIRCSGEQVADNFFLTADVPLDTLLPAILSAFKKAFKSKGTAAMGNGGEGEAQAKA
jgi:Phage tail tube protein, GTA-gp10